MLHRIRDVHVLPVDAGGFEPRAEHRLGGVRPRRTVLAGPRLLAQLLQ
jgi:hypothetical protein